MSRILRGVNIWAEHAVWPRDIFQWHSRGRYLGASPEKLVCGSLALSFFRGHASPHYAEDGKADVSIRTLGGDFAIAPSVIRWKFFKGRRANGDP